MVAMKIKAEASGGKKPKLQIRNPDVEAIFRSYPKKARAKLEALRHLIFDTVRATAGVGVLRELTYGGNRSILFDANDEIDEETLSHCISLALTYHVRSSPRGPKTAASPKSRR